MDNYYFEVTGYLLNIYGSFKGVEITFGTYHSEKIVKL